MESLRNIINDVITGLRLTVGTGRSHSYRCRLSENFHRWDGAALHTSTLRPPLLAARLSRHRLLPRCRSLELPSICSHFCKGQQNA